MKIAEILLEPRPTAFWRMLRQIGVDTAVSVLPRHLVDWRGQMFEKPWEYGPLALHKQQVEDAGFTLAVIEDNPPMDRIRLGRVGSEEEIEQFCTLVRSMGRLGIEVLCYNWMAVIPWTRTSVALRGRGGAEVTGYDHTVLADAPPTYAGIVNEELLWGNLRAFLERVVPVAEEACVKLAMHPDDPPLSPIRGIARIMRSVDAFRRLVELVPSEANALTLCQGNFALMTQDLPGVIREFGGEGRIAFVHFRDVRGTPERFVETFHDEGPTNMLACMRAYRDAGIDVPLRSDHTPTLESDSADVPGYSTLGRLHAVGYIQGLHEAAFGPCGSSAADA
jgi:mannonate dehydratase